MSIVTDLLTADEATRRTMLREQLAGLPADAREQIIADCAAGSAASPAALLSVREALRERWPGCDEVKQQPRGLRVDGLICIDARSVYIYGFAYDNEAAEHELEAHAPDGSRIQLTGVAFRHAHNDADGFYAHGQRRRESGFIAYLKTSREQLRDGWLVTMRNGDGIGLEARAPQPIAEPHAARSIMLSHLRFDQDNVLLDAHTHPAIEAIHASLPAPAMDLFNIGPQPPSPAVSLIIPVFSRIDLMEHQLAAFADDAELRGVEIIYVLDSPELADEMRAKAQQLQELYGLCFRLVVMHENRGFASAVNNGASWARGKRLVVMHSDVMPAQRGWLSAMTRALESEENTGAIGATLLYHDESIQHAGYCVADDGTVAQPRKGLHKDLALGDLAVAPLPVDAISAACMMIDRDVFNAAGRMSDRFVEGEFEDVDLCARLRAMGLSCRIATGVQLYHLEGQSRAAKQRELALPYNRWLLSRHTRSRGNA